MSLIQSFQENCPSLPLVCGKGLIVTCASGNEGELHPSLIFVHWTVHQCTPGFQGLGRGSTGITLLLGIPCCCFGRRWHRGWMASHGAMAVGTGRLCSMARLHRKRRRMKRSERKGRAWNAPVKSWNKGIEIKESMEGWWWCCKCSLQVRFEPQVQLQCLHFGFGRNPVCR